MPRGPHIGGGAMRVRGDSFVDEDGRTLMLRGVNLGGSSKVPFTPNGATHISGGFLDHRGISCPGRPGYLEYLRAVVGKANAFGMSICVDPHQDIGSRFSGGDGAPGWTMEAAGFDLSRLDETGAAITHQVHGDPFPRMIWPTNGGKLAAATSMPPARSCMGSARRSSFSGTTSARSRESHGGWRTCRMSSATAP